MTITLLPPTRYQESYITIAKPVDAIHGYMALKEDDDDLGHRLYCEYQGSRSGRRCLLFSYIHQEQIEPWTYVLTDGVASTYDLVDLINDLAVELDLIETARDNEGRALVDLDRLRDAQLTRTRAMPKRSRHPDSRRPLPAKPAGSSRATGRKTSATDDKNDLKDGQSK